MKNKLVVSMLLILLLATIPIALRIEHVYASPSGPSLSINDCMHVSITPTFNISVFPLHNMMISMPRIMCPNCGTTINLENRREMDLSLIKEATEKHPRTFTELLHITKLLRKKLSLRLKALCNDGTIIKSDGTYRSNGASLHNDEPHFGKRFSKVFHDKRVRTSIMLIGFLISSSASGYVLAAFFAVSPPTVQAPQEPAIVGNFAMALDVSNVKDLYAWQVVVTFDSSKLKVMEIVPGGFIGTSFPFFVNVTDVGEGVLFIGGSLYGEVLGKDGSGGLATIIFGYFVDNYELPTIAKRGNYLETLLLDSNGSTIPIEDEATLTLEVVVQ